jgi:outer membrane protein OmpA-like peptidoglycan-associated protein
MLKYITLVPIFLLFNLLCLAQEQPIELINPSFEDLPGKERVPYGWNDCGFAEETPPDIHPSPNVNDLYFGVDNRPQDGASYLGMVVRSNDTYEAISQRLRSPMLAGNCYQFSIYLSRSKNYLSTNSEYTAMEQFTTPIVLQVFGGSSLCDTKQLLAKSNIITSSRWIRYDFNFKPETDLNYLILRAYYNTPVLFIPNGHILVDNASAIIPVPCEDEVLQLDTLIADNSEEQNSDATATNTEPKTTPKGGKVIEPKEKEKKEPIVENTKRNTESKIINEELDIKRIEVGKKIELKALYFNDDSAVITNQSLPALEELYNFLKNNNKVRIEVGGHTNNLPPDFYCDKLSKARAKAINDYLLKKGISSYRLKYRGYGKREPIASNETNEGRKKNQRVEIKILSIN